MDDSERTAQGAEIVSETIAEKVITTAMESLRKEFTEVIEKVTAVLKEQFSKELTNALDVIYARLTGGVVAGPGLGLCYSCNL